MNFLRRKRPRLGFRFRFGGLSVAHDSSLSSFN
jgi:hypothetical protein